MAAYRFLHGWHVFLVGKLFGGGCFGIRRFVFHKKIYLLKF